MKANRTNDLREVAFTKWSRTDEQTDEPTYRQTEKLKAPYYRMRSIKTTHKSDLTLKKLPFGSLFVPLWVLLSEIIRAMCQFFLTNASRKFQKENKGKKTFKTWNKNLNNLATSYFGSGKTYKSVAILQTWNFKGIQWKKLHTYST